MAVFGYIVAPGFFLQAFAALPYQAPTGAYVRFVALAPVLAARGIRKISLAVRKQACFRAAFRLSIE